MSIYEKIDFYRDDMPRDSKFNNVSGFIGDDGLFYFVEVLGNLTFIAERWLNDFEIVSTDYSKDSDGMRFVLIGARV